MFERDWEPAKAKIIAMKELSNWSDDPSSNFQQSAPYEYVVDVQPSGQPTFRATFRDPYLRGDMAHPREGEVVNVRYHPKSHKVKLIAEEWKAKSFTAAYDREKRRRPRGLMLPATLHPRLLTRSPGKALVIKNNSRTVIGKPATTPPTGSSRSPSSTSRAS